MPGEPPIADLLDDHTAEIADLVMEVRRLIRSVMPDATERTYLGWHGMGLHHPTAGYVCAIFPGAGEVRVGFEHGHLFSDPERVFDPGGKQVRHITLTHLSPALAVRLRDLIGEAIDLRSP
jgi:hypothetical protein